MDPSAVAQLLMAAGLLALVGFAIPTILQVKRTARAVEDFVQKASPGVLSATHNLDSVLGRTDRVMGGIENGSRGITNAVSGLGSFVSNLRSPVPAGSPAASWMAAIASLLSGFIQAWSATSAKAAPDLNQSKPEGGQSDV